MKIAMAVCVLFFAMSNAQEGGGAWGQYYPTGTVQLRGPKTVYHDTGGIEAFIMGAGDERCEKRINNDYKNGINQFEGYVRVTAGQGTSVHQIFKFLMIVAYPQNGGELHQHSGTFLTNGAFGNWVRVNTIHYTATHKADIYIDGVLKNTMDDASPSSPGGWYNKYGVYNTNTGSKSEWRDIRYWKGGVEAGIVPLAPIVKVTGNETLIVYDMHGRRVGPFLNSTAGSAVRLDLLRPKLAAGKYFPLLSGISGP